MKGKNQDETKISKVLEFKDNQTREESFENINIDNDDLNTKPRDVKKIEDTDKQKKLIKLKDKSSKHRNKKGEDKPKKTFGANISELLEESFFLENGLIGDFAKEKIEQTINWLNNCEIKKSNFNNDFYIEDSEKEYHLKVIELTQIPQ